MINNILRAIRLIIAAIGSGGRVTIAHAVSYLGDYIRGIGLLIKLVVLVPLLLVVLGIWLDWSWLTATAGLIWGLALLVLGTWGTPIGVLLGALWEGFPERIDPKPGFFLWRWVQWWTALPQRMFWSVKDGAKWYVGFVRGVILAELIITFLLTILPIRNNIGLAPLFLLAIAVIEVSTAHWKLPGEFWKKLVYGAAIFMVVLCLTSFFFPKASNAVVKKLKLVDGSVAHRVTTNNISGTVKSWFVGAPTTINTNPPVAILLPTGVTDIVLADLIPPGKEFNSFKIPMTGTNYLSPWFHLPHHWGAVDLWTSTNGFYLQHIDEPDALIWFDETRAATTRRSIFRVSGESGFFFIQRKT